MASEFSFCQMGAYLIAKQIVSASTKQIESETWALISRPYVYVVLSKYDNSTQLSLCAIYIMTDIYLYWFIYESVFF